MKVIILAGGQGTRLSEKTSQVPKPMIEVGGRPLLWHIMKHYDLYGYQEFIIALGYLQEIIKEYFLNYYTLQHDLSLNIAKGTHHIYEGDVPNWTLHLINTGLSTQTGGRIKRLKEWIGHETFMMTYGDGLCDVDIEKLVAFHKDHGKLATVTAVHPPSRFGGMTLCENQVIHFSEKPQTGWINGGFFVLEPEVLDFIECDLTMWEKDPLEKLAQQNELMAFCHEGFWQPMDTLRDHRTLENLYATGNIPWLKKPIHQR